VEGVFHKLVFVSIRKTYPMQVASKKPSAKASNAHGRRESEWTKPRESELTRCSEELGKKSSTR